MICLGAKQNHFSVSIMDVLSALKVCLDDRNPQFDEGQAFLTSYVKDDPLGLINSLVILLNSDLSKITYKEIFLGLVLIIYSFDRFVVPISMNHRYLEVNLDSTTLDVLIELSFKFFDHSNESVRNEAVQLLSKIILNSSRNRNNSMVISRLKVLIMSDNVLSVLSSLQTFKQGLEFCQESDNSDILHVLISVLQKFSSIDINIVSACIKLLTRYSECKINVFPSEDVFCHFLLQMMPYLHDERTKADLFSYIGSLIGSTPNCISALIHSNIMSNLFDIILTELSKSYNDREVLFNILQLCKISIRLTDDYEFFSKLYSPLLKVMETTSLSTDLQVWEPFTVAFYTLVELVKKYPVASFDMISEYVRENISSNDECVIEVCLKCIFILVKLTDVNESFVNFSVEIAWRGVHSSISSIVYYSLRTIKSVCKKLKGQISSSNFVRVRNLLTSIYETEHNLNIKLSQLYIKTMFSLLEYDDFDQFYTLDDFPFRYFCNLSDTIQTFFISCITRLYKLGNNVKLPPDAILTFFISLLSYGLQRNVEEEIYFLLSVCIEKFPDLIREEYISAILQHGLLFTEKTPSSISLIPIASLIRNKLVQDADIIKKVYQLLFNFLGRYDESDLLIYSLEALTIIPDVDGQLFTNILDAILLSARKGHGYDVKIKSLTSLRTIFLSVKNEYKSQFVKVGYFLKDITSRIPQMYDNYYKYTFKLIKAIADLYSCLIPFGFTVIQQMYSFIFTVFNTFGPELSQKDQQCYLSIVNLYIQASYLGKQMGKLAEIDELNSSELIQQCIINVIHDHSNQIH